MLFRSVYQTSKSRQPFITAFLPHPPPSSPSCRLCGTITTLGHDEICQQRRKWTHTRHNGVVRAIKDALESIPGTRVDIEPASTGETRERNDLRVWGSLELGSATSEYDVKVYSLFGTNAISTLLPSAPESHPIDPSDLAVSRIDKFLQSIVRKAKNKAPAGLGSFAPLVFTAGGYVEKETQRCLDGWKKELPEGAWDRMVKRISLGLVRVRGRTFEV